MDFKCSALLGSQPQHLIIRARKWQTCYQDDPEGGETSGFEWLRFSFSSFPVTFYLHLDPGQMQDCFAANLNRLIVEPTKRYRITGTDSAVRLKWGVISSAENLVFFLEASENQTRWLAPKILTIQNSMGFKAAKLQNEAIVKKAERLGYKALCLTETWTQDGDSFVELAQLDDLIFEYICSNPFTAILIISCVQSYLVFHFWILFCFLLASFEFDAYFHKKHKLEAGRC